MLIAIRTFERTKSTGLFTICLVQIYRGESAVIRMYILLLEWKNVCITHTLSCTQLGSLIKLICINPKTLRKATWIYISISMMYIRIQYLKNPLPNNQMWPDLQKTRHNDAFMEIQIFASLSSIYLKLCSVVISCKHFLSYKAR